MSDSPSPSPISPLRQNGADPSAKWLVQKFGGTSVGKFPIKIAHDIISNHIDDHRVAVVCSARSGSTKSTGTTNLLLRAATQTLQSKKKASLATTVASRGLFCHPSSRQPSPPSSGFSTPAPSRSSSDHLVAFTDSPTLDFNETIDILLSEHLTSARASIRSPHLLAELEHELTSDCAWLRAFLFAAHVIDEISPRSRDAIVGLGERLACKIMTAVLRDQGVDAEYVNLEDIAPASSTDDSPSTTLDQDWYDNLITALSTRLSKCDRRVPVITGFFGHVPGSLLDQVGRGYTDLLAALTAVALSASELQIWKEVDGIFTADPRKVPTARLIPVISPAEAAELTYYGSEVVHPFTMEQVMRRHIPIRIKNVDNPHGPGTVIYPDSSDDDDIALSSPLNDAITSPTSALSEFSSTLSTYALTRTKLPTAVTIKESMLVLNINSNRKSVSHGFLAGIFNTLDRFNIVVDLISTSEVHVSMAISCTASRKTIARLVAELSRTCGPVTTHWDMAILSLVGREMRNMVGIAGMMFTTLARGGVNIEMISQGASEINISCVIEGRDAVKALNLIHQSCLQSHGTLAWI